MLLEYARYGCLYHFIDHRQGLPERIALRFAIKFLTFYQSIFEYI